MKLHKKARSIVPALAIVAMVLFLFSQTQLTTVTVSKDVIDRVDDIDLDIDPPIMPHMPDATARAELGRASWRLIHTVLARFPETPSAAQQESLRRFVASFAAVYPCGDCAEHFQKLLKKYPVQTTSRHAAALWGCAIHNRVNERLGKPIYDCATILEDYDCGCAEEEEEEKADNRLADLDVEVAGVVGG